MKVLFYVRGNHQEVKGGDLVQLHSTAEALQKKGVKVEFSSDPKSNLSSYDLVHLFNSPRFDETLAFLNNAKKQKRMTVLSTIYWPKDDLAIGIARSLKVRLTRHIFGITVSKAIWRLIKKSTGEMSDNSPYSKEKELFEKADILLPNSEGEMRQIEKNYKIKDRSYAVVKNAIHTEMFKNSPTSQRKPYVLSVGRIENRKNTLKLIRACSELGYDLTLIGGMNKNDPYAKECINLIDKNRFTYISNIPPDKLTPYYYEAQVHAMVSWYETPGLSTMEAACGGCNIVSTDKGSTGEYFGNLVNYCDPFSLSSIKASLKRAMLGKPSPSLRKKIISDYTWDHAADDTIKAYMELLS